MCLMMYSKRQPFSCCGTQSGHSLAEIMGLYKNAPSQRDFCGDGRTDWKRSKWYATRPYNRASVKNGRENPMAARTENQDGGCIKKLYARQSSRSTQELGCAPAKPNSHAAPAYLKPVHFEAPMSPPQLRIRMWSGFALRDRCRLDTNTKLAHELHPQASVRETHTCKRIVLGQNFNGVKFCRGEAEASTGRCSLWR